MIIRPFVLLPQLLIQQLHLAHNVTNRDDRHGIETTSSEQKMNRLTSAAAIGPLLFSGSILLLRWSLNSSPKSTLISSIASMSTGKNQIRQQMKKISPPKPKKCLEQIYFGKNLNKPEEYRGQSPMDPPIV